jgi:hypothetical protein
MSAPFEILTGPLNIWTGPVGEAFTDVDTTPAGNWVLLGTSGDSNYSEDGVSINNPQVVELFRMLGGTGPVKASRSEEDLMTTVTMHDLTLEQWAVAMNGNAVVDTPAASGTPGIRTLNSYKGKEVTQYALLVRGKSPYDDVNWNLQLQIPVVAVTSSPNPIFVKGVPAGLEIEFTAIEDPNAASEALRFGSIVAQDATALA